MNAEARNRWITLAGVLALAGLVGYLGIWKWMICRIEVPAGHSLLLNYRGPFPPIRSVPRVAEGALAQTDKHGRPLQVGILEHMPGPGRHFYSPWEYERKVVEDHVIKPGQIGLVTSRVGKSLPPGAILAEGPGYRGTWRRVLTPGRYRMNPYAYTVKPVDATARTGEGGPVASAFGVTRKTLDTYTLIPPGYVGVVTNKVGNPVTGESQGIQDRVLQPGIYYLNPEEKVVDIVSIGFNETSLTVETRPAPEAAVADTRGDRLGRGTAKDPVYLPGKGIEFPSSDGFTIHLDFTAIWGILPDQAPGIVRQFGALSDVEQKVILPQIGSICRMHGSKRGAVDLLVGDKREEFQTDTAEELERVLEGKDLTLLFGLTRHIYVPNQVREPIQKKNIADELKLTRDQEQLTAKAQADLTEAKAMVVLAERKTKAETTKLVAELTAEGEKKAREIEAETEKLKAQVDARTAAIQAQITTVLGEADARKVELTKQAEAERFAQYVQSLGGPEAYNRYVFAEGLPTDMKLGVFYAGPGTFWTDLKGFEQVLLGKFAGEGMPAPAGGTSAAVKPKAASR